MRTRSHLTEKTQQRVYSRTRQGRNHYHGHTYQLLHTLYIYLVTRLL